MDKNRKTRYVIAIYTIVASLSIILGLLAFRYAEGLWQSTLINLSTELLGAVLVFLLVQILFSIDDWNLSERVKNLLDKLENPKKPTANDFFQSPPNLAPNIAQSNNIDMCGFTLSFVLGNCLGQLKDSISRGAKVRIIIADPASSAVKMSALRSEIPGNIEFFEKRLANALMALQYLFEHGTAINQNKEFEIRLLPFAPNYAIYGFNKGKEDAVVFIESYPHKSEYGSQPWYSLSANYDAHWYQHYIKQFEDLWETAIPWSPRNIQEIIDG